MKKILSAIAVYLKDWKNLLVHALVGVGLLCLALFLPVHPAFRIGILAAVITFNVLRMMRARRRKERAAR